MLSADHTSGSLDEELKPLENTILQMGNLSKRQFADAMRALVTRDTKLGAKVLESNALVEERALEVDGYAVRLLALRQPMAIDLRNIIAALRISIDLERIANYAFNVAERSLYLTQVPPPRPMQTIVQMARLRQEMLQDVLHAYDRRDAPRAYEVWSRDQEVGAVYRKLLGELRTLMIEDPHKINECTDLLFITKSIEAIGDHIKNVAEDIHYIIYGTFLNEVQAGTGCPAPGFQTSPESVY